MGLDVGSRTFGVAVSDPLGLTAQGLPTIRRQNKRRDHAQLQSLIQQYQVTEIVVGYPIRMSGMGGTQSEKMEVFAEELRKKFKLPVHLWDERLTSAEANRLILQGWMDARAGRIDRGAE